jgi:hypothetical protein
MRKKLPIILFLFFGGTLIAQNPGYMGKHFIVKLNLVNGARPLYFGGEVEYAFQKRFTIGIGAGWQTSMYKQVYFVQSATNSNIYNSNITGDDTKINSTYVYAQLKYFPAGGLMTSPQGFYLGLIAGAGSTDIYSSTGKSIMINSSYPNISFTVKGIPFGMYQFGLGYQRILGGRMVIDGGAYLNLTTFNSTGNDSNRPYTATLAREFGPNSLWLFNSAGNTHVQTYDMNFGLSIYLKLGVLIF